MFWVAFVTSCRQGELAALEDKHLIEKDGKYAVYFEQAFVEETGVSLVLKEIKNKVSGYVAIPKELAEMIKVQINQKQKDKDLLKNKWAYPNKVFLYSNVVGKPYRPDSISQWWARFKARHELGNIRFHDLRHLSVTFLISKNMPIKSISDRARHTNIGTTMNIYGHNIVKIDELAADHFSVFFNQKNDK